MIDYYDYVNQPDQDFTTEKDMFRAYYYQCYDFVTNAIEKRFDQPDYKMYGTMESIVTNAVSGKSTTHLFDEQILSNGSSFRSLYEDDIGNSIKAVSYSSSCEREIQFSRCS